MHIYWQSANSIEIRVSLTNNMLSAQARVMLQVNHNKKNFFSISFLAKMYFQHVRKVAALPT